MERIDVRKVYGEENYFDNGNYDIIYNYKPMINAFGEVVHSVTAGGYSGETFVLYRDYETGMPGYLCFGWGSCTGCDALQACDSWDEVQELADQLQNSILWFDTPEKAVRWFKEHDWRGDWVWCYHEDLKTFVHKCIMILQGEDND